MPNRRLTQAARMLRTWTAAQTRRRTQTRAGQTTANLSPLEEAIYRQLPGLAQPSHLSRSSQFQCASLRAAKRAYDGFFAHWGHTAGSGGIPAFREWIRSLPNIIDTDGSGPNHFRARLVQYADPRNCREALDIVNAPPAPPPRAGTRSLSAPERQSIPDVAPAAGGGRRKKSKTRTKKKCSTKRKKKHRVMRKPST